MRTNSCEEWFWDNEFRRYNDFAWTQDNCTRMIGVDSYNSRFEHDEKGVFSHWLDEDKETIQDRAFRCRFIRAYVQSTPERMYFDRMTREEKVKYCSVWVLDSVVPHTWDWYLKEGNKWVKVNMEQYDLSYWIGENGGKE